MYIFIIKNIQIIKFVFIILYVYNKVFDIVGYFVTS